MKNHTAVPLWFGEIPATPLGPISIACSPAGLTQVEYGPQVALRDRLGALPAARPAPPALDVALQELTEYFAGTRRVFTISIDWNGFTEFQELVLRACAAIPYGSLLTYGQLARQVQRPGAARAVGMTMAHNPMPVVIPCHRVVGGAGDLHGYSAPGGLSAKAWLLELEGHHLVDQKLD